MSKKNYIPCDLCGNSEHRILFDGKDRLHNNNGTFSYVMCINCGLVYMNPQISSKDLVGFYPNNYGPHQSQLSKPTQKQKSKKYRKREISLPLSVYQKLNEDSKLLDVGCGNGKFINKIKDLTECKGFGVDISEKAVNMAKHSYGLDVFRGTITEVPFDVVTAWSYLEHVPNPSLVLGKLQDLLKHGGDCIISCPNFDSFNAQLFGCKWYHLDCPRHLYLYTPKTITALLEKNDFVVKKIIHEKSSKGILGSIQYSFYENNYDPKHRNKIKKMPLIKAVTSPLSRLAAIAKKADTIVVHAVKE